MRKVNFLQVSSVLITKISMDTLFFPNQVLTYFIYLTESEKLNLSSHLLTYCNKIPTDSFKLMKKLHSFFYECLSPLFYAYLLKF